MTVAEQGLAKARARISVFTLTMNYLPLTQLLIGAAVVGSQADSLRSVLLWSAAWLYLLPPAVCRLTFMLFGRPQGRALTQETHAYKVWWFSHHWQVVFDRLPWLEQDGVYSVVVTTGGGLYRYRLEDRVKVDSFVGRTPSVRFLGKEGHVADLVGEKLREDFVAAALAQTFESLSLQPRSALLAPETDRGRPRYALYLECDAPLPPELPLALERALQGHGDYRQAVRLGQLAPVEVVRIRRDGLATYLRRCGTLGQRLGAVKPLALSTRTGWAAVFVGAREHGRA